MTSAPEAIAYSPLQAAAALGISRDHVLLAVKLGDLPAYKIGVRTKILRDDLVAWVRRQRRSNAREQA
jgi:excisionase family DNA binding protein